MSEINRDNNEEKAVEPRDAMERRALLLHLAMWWNQSAAS